MRVSFAPPGQRTDGRPFRPHQPWRLNTGAETANPARVTNPGTPRTDFASALAPRLQESGVFTPRLGGLVAPSMKPAPASMPPGVAAGEDQVANLSSFLGAQANPAPSMFAGVNDTGAPLNTAQRFTRAGQQIANGGWVTTNPGQASAIAARYGPKMALGGRKPDLPY